MKIARRREVGVPNLEPRRADLLDAVGAKANQGIGRAFVHDEMKVADRLCPICAGGQHIGDPPLEKGAGRDAIFVGLSHRPARGTQKILIRAISRFVALEVFFFDIRRAELRSYRFAEARAIAMFEADLFASRKSLVPE